MSLAQVEQALKGVIQAVQTGRNDELAAMLEALEAAIAGLDSSEISAIEHLRVQELWKQASLAVAAAGQDAKKDLRQTSAGRTSLKAYKP